MASKRIEYIDALRGLCIFWVVWYHSSHPEWVEYPFRMPTLFFISGIFYKHYPGKVFWKKKVNQYIVPFAFFYLLYYVFLLVINFCKYHSVPSEVYLSFFDFAHMYDSYYRVHSLLLSLVPNSMNQLIHVAMYHQYFSIFNKYMLSIVDTSKINVEILSFLHGQMRNTLVVRSFDSYKPKGFKETLVHYVVKYGFYRIYYLYMLKSMTFRK